jgi:hypothetical protein
MSSTPSAGSPGSREVKKNWASRHLVFARFSMLRKASRFLYR